MLNEVLYDLDPSSTSPNENLPRINIEKGFMNIYHSGGHREYRITFTMKMDGNPINFNGRGTPSSRFSEELKNYSIYNQGVQGQFNKLAPFCTRIGRIHRGNSIF